ncbi:MAG TPA: AI-2E family transporter [Usitatibacter sp.]|nr:AI-2E family transporter [Usitatibacter sp.]
MATPKVERDRQELDRTLGELGNGALVMLAVIAGIGVLYVGAPFFIPLFVALLIAFALTPVTDQLTRLVRYRAAAAGLVVAGVLALMGLGGWAWSDDAVALWERVPEAAKKIATSLKRSSQKVNSSPVAEVKKAAAEIESLAQTGKSPPPTTAATAPPSVSFWGMVSAVGKNAVVVMSQVISVVFLVFFMLASGDMFKRKLVRMFGDTLSEKKITVQTIDEIDNQIRRYLAVVVISNLLVGLGTWIAFRMMGVSYAELWGVAAGVIHTAPYFGPAIIAGGSLIGAFLQFGEWPKAFAVSGVSILVATLVGSVFATWLSARQTKMNTTATFVGLLFFGWIWGLWGILLAIPILAIVKTICERSEAWHPVAELLGAEEPAKRLNGEVETSPAAPVPNRNANP